MSEKELWELGFKIITTLETESGILASGRDEVYGCIFGRDSLITSLALLRSHEQSKNPYFTRLVRKILWNMADLQGKKINIENGEEPGKIIHEYRPTNHKHLTMAEMPWFLDPDKVMRNYDSVDSTPLFLMTAHNYLRASKDELLIEELLPNIRAALDWLLNFGDTNNDGFIDYRFHPDRTHGGLKTQSWMDSAESLFFETDNSNPAYPVAPVEVQAYAYVALRMWSQYFKSKDAALAEALDTRATDLKEKFNQTFVLQGKKSLTLAFAIDGNGKKLTAPRSSMGHVLWAVWRPNGLTDCILEESHIPALVRRLLSRDLFVRRAGIRTLSSRSLHFDPYSYHNGSIWPHDTEMLAEGLENFGYTDEARCVRQALRRAYQYFKTPIELFVYTKRAFDEYQGSHCACRTQAWSAASLLAAFSPAEPVAPIAEPELI